MEEVIKRITDAGYELSFKKGKEDTIIVSCSPRLTGLGFTITQERGANLSATVKSIELKIM